MSGSFGIGSALGTGTRLWLRNLPACVVFAIAGYLPLVALYVAATYTPLGDAVGTVMNELYAVHPQAYAVAVRAVYALAFALGGAAVTWRIVTALDGARASIRQCLAHVLRRVHVVLGVALVAYLAIDGTRALVTELVLVDPRYGVPITRHAIVAEHVVRLVLQVGFVLALAAVVSERTGVVGAIARGWRLSAGVRVKLFALLLTFAVLAMLLHVLLRLLILPPGVRVDPDTVGFRVALLAYASIAVGGLLMTFSASVSAVAYAQLRADREGPSERELTRVFD